MFALLALVGLGASLVMFWVTACGAGVSPDSVGYLSTASSLLAEKGFMDGDAPMTAYPPLYPFLLALGGFFHQGNVLVAARWIGILLFGANLALFGLSIFIGTRSVLAMSCGMVAFLLSAPVIRLHAMAWSEPPLIALTLAAFILLALYVDRPRRLLLLATALCAGGACATRYLGVALLPPLVAALFFLGERSLKRRIGDSVLFALVALIPLAVWLGRNLVLTGEATRRTWAPHVVGLGFVRQASSTLANFLWAASLPRWGEALLVGGIGILFLVSLASLASKNGAGRGFRSAHVAVPALGFLFFLTTLLLLSISISFFDAATQPDFRILLPAFLGLLIAALSLAWAVLFRSGSRIGWGVFLLVMMMLLARNGVHAVSEAVRIHRHGSDYTSLRWKQSETIAAIRALSKDVSIYSNGPDAIRFLSGKHAVSLPPVYSMMSLQANPDYPAQRQAVLREVDAGSAVVVYFTRIKRAHLPSLQELETGYGLQILGRWGDGVILGRIPVRIQTQARAP